jgi:hypothetical protein
MCMAHNNEISYCINKGLFNNIKIMAIYDIIEEF